MKKQNEASPLLIAAAVVLVIMAIMQFMDARGELTQSRDDARAAACAQITAPLSCQK